MDLAIIDLAITALLNYSTIKSLAPNYTLEAKFAKSSNSDYTLESNSKYILLVIISYPIFKDNNYRSKDNFFTRKVIVKLAILEDP